MTESAADAREHDLVDLPTEAVLDRTEDGWSIRLPVRSEAIHVRKQVVLSQRVVVRRVLRDDVERINTTVRRERLHVDTPAYDALDAASRAELERDGDAVINDGSAEPVESPSEPPAGRRQARRSSSRRRAER